MIVHVRMGKFRTDIIPLTRTRAFVFRDVVLAEHPHGLNFFCCYFNPRHPLTSWFVVLPPKNTTQEVLEKFLDQQIEEMLEEAAAKAPSPEVLAAYPALAKPLLRLRVCMYLFFYTWND